MSWWYIILIAMVVAAAFAVFYLSTRFAKFLPEDTRKKLGFKRYFVGVIPTVPLIIYALIDTVNGVVVMVHIMVIWAIGDLIGKILKRVLKDKKLPWGHFYMTGAIVIVFCVGYLSFGWYLAHHVVETDYVVETKKDIGVNSLRIAQISDSHIGATFDGEGFANHMTTIANANPDVIVVTGDYVDDDTEREDMEAACEALWRIHPKYGIYFVYGNHDKGYMRYRDFDDKILRECLTRNDIKILEDETVNVVGNIYITGRKDKSEERRDGRKSMEELSSGMDKNAFNIVLDHQPNDYDAEQAAGVDLVLSGHTHGGQFIPIGVLGVLTGLNDKTYGEEKRGDTTFIVNSGIGDWALDYKTGTVAEFGIIDIKR